MDTIGVNLGKGRTSHYDKVLGYWKDNYDTAPNEEAKTNLPDFISSIFEIHEFITVHESLKIIHLKKLSSIAIKLQKAVNGPIKSSDESAKSTAARKPKAVAKGKANLAMTGLMQLGTMLTTVGLADTFSLPGATLSTCHSFATPFWSYVEGIEHFQMPNTKNRNVAFQFSSRAHQKQANSRLAFPTRNVCQPREKEAEEDSDEEVTKQIQDVMYARSRGNSETHTHQDHHAHLAWRRTKQHVAWW